MRNSPRFDNGQSWEYWTSGLAPVQSQIDDQMPVDPPEALRSDRAFRKKEPARHVEPDELDESLPPTMGDSDALEPEVFETDEENETATEANASQSRKKRGPYRRREEIRPRELNNYIFFATCIKHTPSKFINKKAVAKELGIKPHSVENKLGMLKKRLDREGANIGNYG